MIENKNLKSSLIYYVVSKLKRILEEKSVNNNVKKKLFVLRLVKDTILRSSHIF